MDFWQTLYFVKKKKNKYLPHISREIKIEKESKNKKEEKLIY